MKKAIGILLLIVLASCSGKKTESEKKEGENSSKDGTDTMRKDTSLPKGMIIPEKHDSVAVVSEGRPGAIVRITHGVEDRFSVCAGLKTAEDLNQKFAVVVYFDLRGIEIPLKATPDFDFAPYPSSRGQLKKLKDLGVTLVVSRTALAAGYKKPGDVIEGVKISDPDEVLGFTKGNITTLEF